MKKAISLLLLVVCICGMMGCEKASGPEVEINYGNSSVYSKEEMDEAIEIIQEAFAAWDGCELQSISYSSDDECSSENISWLNDLMEAYDLSDEFTQCIMFESDFHTSENASAVWNPDTDYKDYQWWLARTSDNSEWQLVTWGYC